MFQITTDMSRLKSSGRITNKNVNIGMCVQGMIFTFCPEMFDLCSCHAAANSLSKGGEGEGLIWRIRQLPCGINQKNKAEVDI